MRVVGTKPFSLASMTIVATLPLIGALACTESNTGTDNPSTGGSPVTPMGTASSDVVGADVPNTAGGGAAAGMTPNTGGGNTGGRNTAGQAAGGTQPGGATGGTAPSAPVAGGANVGGTPVAGAAAGGAPVAGAAAGGAPVAGAAAGGAPVAGAAADGAPVVGAAAGGVPVVGAAAGGAPAVGAGTVKVTEEMFEGVGTYKVEMPMGIVYFEKDDEVSGFKGFLDSEGKDWIKAYYGPGPQSNFRGFPNSTDNFGHAGRPSGSTTTIVDGVTEGSHVILESTNGKFTFQYWFFADHISIKILKAEGTYQLQLEGVIGGTATAEDYFVTGDGEKHIPNREFDDFDPEWIYLGDPTAKDLMFMAKTPEDDAPNINRRQIRDGNKHNMDLYSFSGLTGTDHVIILGFAPGTKTHEEMTAMIEGFLADPFAD